MPIQDVSSPDLRSPHGHEMMSNISIPDDIRHEQARLQSGITIDN
jgi:hypothetical protein